MWQVTPEFLAELKKPVHQTANQLDFLDTDFRVVFSCGSLGSDHEFVNADMAMVHPGDAIIDGTVDVDISRGTRRTLTMTLLNNKGVFSPDPVAGPMSPTADWDGFFYVNRLIRVHRGVTYHDGTKEAAPLGTFMVDKAECIVERGMSTVVISGSDLWKKFSKSQFGSPRTFTKNTNITTIVSTLASEAGVTRVNIDPLASRSNGSKQIQTALNWEAGDTRGDALLKIATDYGLDIYFDPMGTLVMEDFKDPFARPAVWSFTPDDDMAFFLRNVIDDDRLYNHTVVVGTGATQTDPPGPIYKAEVKNTDPGSPTNITRLGDRVFRFESGVLASQESVNKAAITIFYRHFLLSNTVAMEAICNPALEGNDVIEVREDKFSGLDQRFLLSSFSVPLTTSKQKLSMKQVLDISPALS